MTGGDYTLVGGFRGLIAAIQTPGAPRLTITLNPQLATVTVSWPAPAGSWRLHATTTLVSGGSARGEIAPPYQTHGTNLVFIEAAPTGNKFYRLHRP